MERFHRTLRKEFFGPNDHRFATIAEAQAALDAWVHEYNHDRPHQSVGDRPPIERFGLAGGRVEPTAEASEVPTATSAGPRPAGVMRWVDQAGRISLVGVTYKVGRVFAREPVEVVVRRGLVEVLYKGRLIATHAERRRDTGAPPRAGSLAPRVRRSPARAATSGPMVTRVADANGCVSFAGSPYRAGRAWARQRITVAVVAGSVQLSADGNVLRVHPIRHDRTKEHGAYATPNGRPRKATSP